MGTDNEDGRAKAARKKKKVKSTPNKEKQISLRLSAKGAKRLSKLTEKKEWSVTQVIEEALKVYAAHENITMDDKLDDKPADKAEEKAGAKTEGPTKEGSDTPTIAA